MDVKLFTAAFDDRYGKGKITSRIGLSAPAELYESTSDLYAITKRNHQTKPLGCIFIDEAQFLTKSQVKQCLNIVDQLNVPVLAYGLRTDFKGETFEGSHYLLAWADKLTELKTVCHCGRKANFVARTDQDGNAINDGKQVDIGGNDKYVSLCRKHYAEQTNFY